MSDRFEYPPARRGDVVDDYHGTAVSDPYRWLEAPEAEETRAFVQAQNALTRRYLERVPAREQIEARLRALWNYDRETVPKKRGGGGSGIESGEGAHYFFQRQEGLQDQPVLYWQNGREGEPRTLLDPNELSEEGTVALTNYFPSDDGALVAYALSSSGSDWQSLRVLSVTGDEEYDDVLRWVKFTPAAWLPDGSGFFYARYPEPGAMPDAPPSTHHRVYWHRLGAAQEEDVLVYARPDNPDLGFQPAITEDGDYLILHVWQGTDVRNRIYYRPLPKAGGEEIGAEGFGDFIRLLDEGDARYEFIGNVGERFYFHSDYGAPRGRVIVIDLDQPEREQWQEVVPEGEDVIDAVRLVGGHLVVVTLHHAAHRLHLYTLEGEPVSEIELPAPGSITNLSGRQQDEELFFDFHSFLHPPTIYRYSLERRELFVRHRPEVDFDPHGYTTEQFFYRSKDGTQVPMFLIHKRGLERDGDNPTLLYGYGGFAVNVLPTFSTQWLIWLEMGGVVAIANLRGGNEYGEAWHHAGMLEKKQNVFDDFIAAAEWLVDSGYTKRTRLAIMGRSNGGLLVSAVMVQRPELFGAVVSGVPVADMLRYHRFTAGRYWTPEYGNAEENPEQFAFLYRYSPVHNVQMEERYPPTLITTADTDDRVVPMHAKKLAATLQAADAGANPILLRVETAAGHGLGKPTSKIIEELADVYAFLIDALDVEL